MIELSWFARCSAVVRRIAVGVHHERRAAHLSSTDDVLVRVQSRLELRRRWARPLLVEPDPETLRQLWRHEATGPRRAGTASECLLKRLEKLLARPSRPGKPGRKK